MTPEKRRLKFWKWVFKFARKKFKAAHIDVYKNDIKCIGCNQWFSVSGIDHTHEYDGEQPDFGIRVKCGACGKVNYYNLVIAPVAIYCDEKGTPID